MTGFGNSPPNATYFVQDFVAESGGLDSLLFPIIGPGAFRGLITEVDDLLRPTVVLFQSPAIVAQVSPTWYPDRPLFFFGSGLSGAGGAHWINTKSGNRAVDFAHPVRTDPSQNGADVWTFDDSGKNFALCLIFGGTPASSCPSPLISGLLVSGLGVLPEEILVNFGGLNLVAGRRYAVVWDGASVPEPGSLSLITSGLVFIGARWQFRRRPRSATWIEVGSRTKASPATTK